MQIEKKRVLKEDGRYMVFYHFPATATPEQKAAFESLTEGQVEPHAEAAETEEGEGHV